MNQLADWTEYAYTLAVQAGKAIMKFYDKDQPVTAQYKADNSPVTIADHISHQIIMEGLSQYELDNQSPAPVLSEEGKFIPFLERQLWDRYWCVDPLDGTKDFLAHNGEFTVNIALLMHHEPILGVIYVPAQQCGYLAWRGGGAYRCDNQGNRQRIVTQVPPADPLRLIVSRYHGLESLQPWLAGLGETTLIHQGSSLKFCELARGNADVFLRLSPSSEWDNAAGQCILQEAGGAVFSWDRQQSLPYNRSGTLEQQKFIAVGDLSYPWQKYFFR